MSADTSRLHDRLDELVEDAPLRVAVDRERAWRAGRARRVRDRVVVVAAAVAVVAAVTGWAVMAPEDRTPPPSDAPSGGVHQYPTRLDHAYWSPALPDDSGPLAGLVQRNGNGVSGWYAVSPTGRLWELGRGSARDDVPALSPDGTRLGYLRGSMLDADYVLVDQRNGTVTTFPEIGTGAYDGGVEEFDTDHRYYAAGQAPTYWSPDSSALLIRGGTTDPEDPAGDVTALVLRPDGTTTPISTPEDADGSSPLGWLTATRIAVLEWSATRSEPSRVWVVDSRSGRALDSFSLRGGGRNAAEAGQWFGTVSPDGRVLATSTTLDGEQVRLHSMRGPLRGDVTGRMPGVPSPADMCSASWSSDDLYVPSQSNFQGGSSVLVRVNGGTTVLVDPRLAVVCSVWARDALDGTPYEGWGSRLFGQRAGWLAWHWREVALGAGGGPVAVVLLLLRRRARRRLGSTQPR